MGDDAGMLHEDEGAERLLALCANENMERSGVKEGKIELKASCDGCSCPVGIPAGGKRHR